MADAEIEAFKNFENPDMYYEYYPELYSRGCRGSMVPFHFRLLAAEIPQYMRKTNETYDKLTHILTVARQVQFSLYTHLKYFTHKDHETVSFYRFHGINRLNNLLVGYRLYPTYLKDFAKMGIQSRLMMIGKNRLWKYGLGGSCACCILLLTQPYFARYI